VGLFLAVDVYSVRDVQRACWISLYGICWLGRLGRAFSVLFLHRQWTASCLRGNSMASESKKTNRLTRKWLKECWCSSGVWIRDSALKTETVCFSETFYLPSLHGTKSHKNNIIILTAVKKSNLTTKRIIITHIVSHYEGNYKLQKLENNLLAKF
jgi:hypothetical protein